MNTVLKSIGGMKKFVVVALEKFDDRALLDLYEIEKLVLPPEVIASLDTDRKWFQHNLLTIIAIRDTVTGKLVGFFNTLPVNDFLYKEISSGDFDDTKFEIKDICQYNTRGIYNLYLCSFCIHPAYKATSTFVIIYRAFIDFLIKLATERGIYFGKLIADAVTPDGVKLCEYIGMKEIVTSTHNLSVYEISLIPATNVMLKANKYTKKLLECYQKLYL